MSFATCSDIMAQVTLERLEDEEITTLNGEVKKVYQVTRKADGKVLGKVNLNPRYQPNVNYRGTRIRKPFKGSPKWFAEFPFGMKIGFRPWHMPKDSRWQAVQLLLETHAESE